MENTSFSMNQISNNQTMTCNTLTTSTLSNTREISMLINPVYYFLDWALIVVENNQFLLKVKRAGKITTNTGYTTLKGAKGAFYLAYRKAGFRKNVKPEWSKPYIPDPNWLKSRLEDGNND